jgi:hypothetical protein
MQFKFWGEWLVHSHSLEQEKGKPAERRGRKVTDLASLVLTGSGTALD